MTQPAPLPPARAKVVFGAATFLRWFAAAMPMALLVLLLQSRGMSLLQVGLILAVHSGVVVVLEVPTGGLADAIGRKRVAIAAQTVTMLAGIVGLFAFSFPGFVATAALLGTGRALSSGALDAWFVDTLLAHDPRTDLQPPLAVMSSLTVAGLALGALAGGAIPTWIGDRLPSDPSAILTPLSLPLGLSSVVQLILIVIIVVAVVEVRPGRASTAEEGAAGSEPAPTGIRALRSILAQALRAARDNRIVSMILLVTVAGGIGISALETFWQPRFADLFGASATTVPEIAFGAILAGAFTLSVAGNLVSIPLARALGRRHGLVALIAQGFTGLAILGLALASSVPLALAGFWLAYFGAAVNGSPLGTILNEEVPSERRSATLSVVSLAGQFGALVGSATFGLLAQAAGIPVVWTVAGIVMLIAVLPLVVVDREREAKRALSADAA